MARLDGQRFADLTLNIINILRENRFSNETFTDTFMRVIGLSPNINVSDVLSQAADLSTRTQQKTAQAVTGSDGDQDKRVTTGQNGATVVDGLFKSQDKNQVRMRQLISAYIENLLSFVKRWGRLQRGQQYRRIQRLIGNAPLDPFDPLLVGATPIKQVELHAVQKGPDSIRIETVNVAEVVRQINQGLKEIELSRQSRSAGLLTLQLSLYNLILQQLTMLMSSIPQSQLGEFGGALTSILKSTIDGVEATGRKLTASRRTLGVELTKLQEQSALIIDGIVLETGEKFSLQGILQALFYLTSKVEYKCKNCQFFSHGQQIDEFLPPDIIRENTSFGAICTFSFADGVGKATSPDSSCKDVWGLSGNDYWTASDKVKSDFQKELGSQ